MRVTWLAVCCAALAGLGACGGDDSTATGYPSDVRDNFMRACKLNSSGNDTACRCILDRLEETVPYEDFKKADAAIRGGDKADADTGKKIAAATKGCR